MPACTRKCVCVGNSETSSERSLFRSTSQSQAPALGRDTQADTGREAALPHGPEKVPLNSEPLFTRIKSPFRPSFPSQSLPNYAVRSPKASSLQVQNLQWHHFLTVAAEEAPHVLHSWGQLINKPAHKTCLSVAHTDLLFALRKWTYNQAFFVGTSLELCCGCEINHTASPLCKASKRIPLCKGRNGHSSPVWLNAVRYSALTALSGGCIWPGLGDLHLGCWREYRTFCELRE